MDTLKQTQQLLDYLGRISRVVHIGARIDLHQNHIRGVRAQTTPQGLADAVINGKVQPKRAKAMDMIFHWLRDRECQRQFRIYWRPGKMNYADYWTKHHPEAHHRNIRKEFLTPNIILEMLRVEQQQKRYAAHAA